MKILNADQYISERIKVQPVTNAELKKAQDNIKLHTLQQGDIVYFKREQYAPYVVIMEKSLYTKVMLPMSLKSYDCTCGVIMRTQLIGASPNFMLVSDYDATSLECKGNHDFDIVKVCRGHLNPIKPDYMAEFVYIDNLKALAKNFTVVFENGKWI